VLTTIPAEVFDPVDIAMAEYSKNAIPITCLRET
jgi:DNA-directed RNA polymerase subunit K/omega